MGKACCELEAEDRSRTLLCSQDDSVIPQSISRLHFPELSPHLLLCRSFLTWLVPGVAVPEPGGQGWCRSAAQWHGCGGAGLQRCWAAAVLGCGRAHLRQGSPAALSDPCQVEGTDTREALQGAASVGSRKEPAASQVRGSHQQVSCSSSARFGSSPVLHKCSK